MWLIWFMDLKSLLWDRDWAGIWWGKERFHCTRIRADGKGAVERHQVETKSADARLDRSARCERIGDQLGGQVRVVDDDDQLRVMLVMQPDADGLVRVMHVPESPLAVLQEAAGGDESRDARPCHAKPVKYAMRLRHTRIHPRDVLEGHLEPAREGEELVGAGDMDDKTGRSQLDRGHRPKG